MALKNTSGVHCTAPDISTLRTDKTVRSTPVKQSFPAWLFAAVLVHEYPCKAITIFYLGIDPSVGKWLIQTIETGLSGVLSHKEIQQVARVFRRLNQR